MIAHEEEVLIRAPRPMAFVPIEQLRCPMCGVRLTWWDRVVVVLKGANPSVMSFSFCPGGRAPVEEISNPIEAMIRGREETRPTCGGVAEPHLHVKCNACGHQRLMKTKGEER